MQRKLPAFALRLVCSPTAVLCRSLQFTRPIPRPPAHLTSPLSRPQTLLRLLLSILRGPLTADEAGASGGPDGMQGVQAGGRGAAQELRLLEGGPVIELGAWLGPGLGTFGWVMCAL